MSLLGGDWTGRGGPVRRSGDEPGQIELRRAVRPGVVCEATLACPECDAPIALHGGALRAADRLTCPFCAHGGPVRAFLTLGTPTRAQHVVVRVDVLP